MPISLPTIEAPLRTIEDVVQRQLCTGCGACAYLEPDRYRMGDAVDHGRRPFPVDRSSNGHRASNRHRASTASSNDQTGDAFRVCPGHQLEHNFDRSDPELIGELTAGWGPVYEVWEGHAVADPIRFAGSSGGAATALALYCLEQTNMSGVLHCRASESQPYRNETVYSTTRAMLLSATGSRYAPASPCESLEWIEQADFPSVFIGKPCDVAAVQRAGKIRPQLEAKLGLTIAFFCAGVPSTRGTLELLKRVGVHDPDSIQQLRYRGNGWPGNWTVQWRDPDGTSRKVELSYEESWDFLQAYRQWRCYICPDHTGEFADVAVGDPWYRAVQAGEAGSSLIVARTPRGREIIHAAAAAGYLKLITKDARLLPRSQPNLLATRGSLWARLRVLRLLRAGVPEYRGFETFCFWRQELTIKQKIQSFTGTAKRVFRKRLHQAVIVSETPDRKPGKRT